MKLVITYKCFHCFCCSAAILASTFLTSVASYPPPPAPPTPPPKAAPAPAPAPVPVPAPAPPLAPPPGPAPAPPPSNVTCTYSGQYLIESVSCPGRYMAFRNEKSQCKNSTVMLRTDKQSQGNRKIWKLNASAVSGVTPKPSDIIAVGRLASCPSSKVTYLAAANGAPTPRLAGSGWKFIITPISASKSCDTISLQATGNNPYVGKYLGYGSCSSNSQTLFTWGSSTNSTSAQWKITKS